MFPCPSLSWHGMVIHFARELLALFWCCALFRLSFLVHMFGDSCTGGMCHLSCGIHAVYMLPILSEHGLWLDGKWFCPFDIRFIDDFLYGLTYNVVSCTIRTLQEPDFNDGTENQFELIFDDWTLVCICNMLSTKFLSYYQCYLIKPHQSYVNLTKPVFLPWSDKTDEPIAGPLCSKYWQFLILNTHCMQSISIADYYYLMNQTL